MMKHTSRSKILILDDSFQNHKKDHAIEGEGLLKKQPSVFKKINLGTSLPKFESKIVLGIKKMLKTSTEMKGHLLEGYVYSFPSKGCISNEREGVLFKEEKASDIVEEKDTISINSDICKSTNKVYKGLVYEVKSKSIITKELNKSLIDKSSDSLIIVEDNKNEDNVCQSIPESIFSTIKERVKFYENVFKGSDKNIRSLEEKVGLENKVNESPIVIKENTANIKSLIKHYETVFK
ncbi:hypothetical protein P3W45_001047 [Vairimorpha bombi]